jgi:hypothetical protein
MGKKDGPDRFEVKFSDADREKAQELLRERALKSALTVTARDDKENLLGVIRDWLRE